MPFLDLPRLRRLPACLLLFGFLLSAVSCANAQTTPAKEYQVKAVFLFNFTQFVDWPPTNFADAQAPFVIGVLGDDPFGPFLDETVRGEKVNGHPLAIQRFKQWQDVKACQILFISRSESDRLNQIQDGLKGRDILTVGDVDNFVDHGGVIGFRTQNGKIRFRINTTAAKTANLTVSSKLLSLAEVVTKPEK